MARGSLPYRRELWQAIAAGRRFGSKILHNIAIPDWHISINCRYHFAGKRGLDIPGLFKHSSYDVIERRLGVLYFFKKVIVCPPPFFVSSYAIKAIKGPLELPVRRNISSSHPVHNRFVLVKPHALCNTGFYNTLCINVNHGYVPSLPFFVIKVTFTIFKYTTPTQSILYKKRPVRAERHHYSYHIQ